MERMAGKVAIVTGAGSTPGPGVGSGKAISMLFAREGASIVLMDVDQAQGALTLAAIEAEGGQAALLVGDVTVAADCARAVATAEERYGRLTTLVNNVGITVSANVEDLEEDDWDRVLAVNVKSAFLMAKHAVGALERAGGGSITNISSIAALRAAPGQTAYTAAKGAMRSLTTLWAIEQGDKGIRVNTVSPGNMTTPFFLSGNPSEERMWYRRNLNPLGLEGTAWDVAWAAVFLASDEARWVSGVDLPVDGGYVAGTPLWGTAVAARKPAGL
jgi:NAD(P)-dependent dehydrogenase (short-subunit alcohol dehydrogenase family)